MVNPLLSVVVVTWNREEEVVNCVQSILGSTYKNFEIIVVDNNSSDNTVCHLMSSFGNSIILIKNRRNLMAAGGRNAGAKSARGKYILFIDSDNIIDKDMVSELIRGIQSLSNAGIVGPLMYYYKDPNRIWCAGAEINLMTSKTTYIGHNEIDVGDYDEPCEVGHIPNIFMCCKDAFESLNGFDERFQIMYEESDLAERFKKKSLKVYLYPSAKAWHNVPMYSKEDNTLRSLGLQTENRAYLISRNRIYFMRKNSNCIQFSFFITIFLPLFTSFYIFKILQNKNCNIALAYLKGVRDGLKFICL